MNLRSGFLKRLLFVLVVMFQLFDYSLSFADTPRDELFKRAVQILVANLKEESIWSEEVAIAMRIAAEATGRIDLDLIATVRHMLRTPEDAFDVIAFNFIGRGDLGVSAKMANSILSYSRSGQWVAHRIARARVPSLGAIPQFSPHYLNRYEVERMGRLIGEIEPRLPIHRISDYFGESISKLQQYLSTRANRSSPSKQWVAEEYEFLNGLASRIEEGIRLVNRDPAVQSLEQGGRHLLRELEQALRNLQDLCDGTRRFASRLLFDVGIEDIHFFMAQIQFADLEAQKAALHLLLNHLNQKCEILTISQLREILSHRSNPFRQHAVSVLKAEADLSMEVKNAIDGVFLKTIEFFPGEPEFEEAVHILSILLRVSPHMEYTLGNVLKFSRTSVEKIAIVRALGCLESEDSFLLIKLFAAHEEDPAVIRACVDEMVKGLTIYPQRFGRVERVLSSLYQSQEPQIRREAIRGVGGFPLGDDEYKMLLRFLATEKEPLIQAEILTALSNSAPQEEGIKEVGLRMVRQGVNHPNPDVRVAAAVYLLREGTPQDGISAATTFVKILEEGTTSRGALPSQEYQLLMLREVGNNFHDIPPRARELLLGLVNRESPDAVSLEALSLMSRGGDPQVAQIFLEIFDRVSGSQKRRIIQELLAHYGENSHILRETLGKSVAFCNDPRYTFDLLDGLSGAVLERPGFFALSQDPETLSFLRGLRDNKETNFRAKRLAEALLDKFESR